MSNGKQKTNAKEKLIGCAVLLVLAALLGWGLESCFDGKPAKVDPAASREKQQRQAAKISAEAYLMALTAINQSLPDGKLPAGLEFAPIGDCLITWQDVAGPNRFCAKIRIDSKQGERKYLFVDLDYRGDGKWQVLAVRAE